MHLGRLQQVSTLLLLEIFFGGLTTIALADYGDFLETQFIDEQLRLLGPESLLKNAKIFREKRRQHHHEMVDAPCARDLAIYQLAIDQRKSWALKMFDASSKLPSGMLQGHVIDMGMFDECTEAHGQLDVGTEIHGRHCMYAIQPSAQHQRYVVNPRLSICLPASCHAEDVVDLLQETINSTVKLKELGIDVASASCTPVPEAIAKSPSTTFIVTSIIAVVYVTFLVFCTICDLVKRRRTRVAQKEDNDNNSLSGIMETLERLSLLKSAEEIFCTASPRKNDLAVIHGLRAISICWMLLVHEYLAQFMRVNVNVVDITKWFSTWKAMYPLIGVFSVDTFLALSGFLMTYNTLRQIRRTNEFNVALHYRHRFTRLSFPVVALFVAMVVLLPGFAASGPRYEWVHDIFINGCGRKWWSVLLYMQNLVETDNYCLLHLWSLSVDMQLYLLSPLLLYPLYKRPKFGLWLLLIFIFASALASGWIVGANEYSAIYFSHDYNVTRVMEAFQNVYQVPWTRASPWLIGTLFAYLVVDCHSVVVSNKKWIFTGWALAVASFAFCVFGTRSFTHANYKYNLWWEVTFAALQKPLWAFGICWIIYASIHNAAGPISSLLSAKIFLPISRLSYTIYLVHLVLPLSLVATCRTPTYFHQYTILHSYISNMVLSIVLGFFFSLMFEQPILILEDVIFKRKPQEYVAPAANVTQKAK